MVGTIPDGSRCRHHEYCADADLDLDPEFLTTLHAYFDPNTGVTRAAYSVAADCQLTVYQSAQD